MLYVKIKFSCIEPHEKPNNNNLTRLILREQSTEAVSMIINNKDLKFNRDLMDCCDGNNSCNGYFKSFIEHISGYDW
jgi:hypothetical protein